MSMDSLAQVAKVSKTTVQNWEQGKGLKGPNLIRLASALGVTVDELTAGLPADDEALRIANPSLRGFLERNREAQGITEEELAYLASIRFPPGQDYGNDGYWVSQVFIYRSLSASAPEPPNTDPPAKRGVKRR
jgi:DNA-binding XRE family transcriptional regulator